MAKRKKTIKKKLALPNLPKLDLTKKKQGFEILFIGIILALILGGISTTYGFSITTLILVIGVIVGLLNIFHKEGVLFLILGLTITFMLSILANLPLFPNWAINLFNAVIYLLVPANIVVGLKVLYALAK